MIGRGGGGGEPVMSMYEMVHITVWYLANQCVMREISVKFGRTISSVWRAVDRVTSILEENQHLFIKWPALRAAPAVATAFSKRAGFPGIIGAMDGTYISIECPKENGNDYLNRKIIL